MKHLQSFSAGDRVHFSLFAPIDFEGLGPRPGTTGLIVRPPLRSDPRRSWRVRFPDVSGEWPIPEEYLEGA